MENSQRSERGATMVEATIALPILLFVIFTGYEISRLLYQAVTIEYVVVQVSREIATIGATQGSSGSYPDRVSAIKGEMRALSGRLGLELTDQNIFVCPTKQFTQNSATPCTPDAAGGPNELVVMGIRRPVELLFRNITYNLSSSVLIRNEPFA